MKPYEKMFVHGWKQVQGYKEDVGQFRHHSDLTKNFFIYLENNPEVFTAVPIIKTHSNSWILMKDLSQTLEYRDDFNVSMEVVNELSVPMNYKSRVATRRVNEDMLRNDLDGVFAGVIEYLNKRMRESNNRIKAFCIEEVRYSFMMHPTSLPHSSAVVLNYFEYRNDGELVIE